jgi:hypothetical protein
VIPALLQEVPLLMLPYLLVQLLLVSVLVLAHTMLALVSAGSNVTYGMLLVFVCVVFIGKANQVPLDSSIRN